VTPAARRKAVVQACAVHEVSERRACQVMGVDRSSMPYRGRRAGDASGAAPHSGARRPAASLRLPSLASAIDPRRLSHEPEALPPALPRGEAAGAQARRPHAGIGVRAPISPPSDRNERWSLDLVSDSFTDGRRFRILAIVDDFTRESLALIPDTSLSGARVARELDALIAWRGRPRS
jgi:putative transposase